VDRRRRGFICATGLVCNNLTFGPGLNVPPTATFNQEISWFATFRGRAGFLATPTALFYATGGLAVAGIKTDGVINAFNAASAPVAVAWGHDTTRVGWVVGAGLEARLTGNWTGKIEGLYMHYGTVSGSVIHATATPPLRFDYSSRITDVVVRGGINYHFGGPVVAKY
jgi:outer membrane immunogenic protein